MQTPHGKAWAGIRTRDLFDMSHTPDSANSRIHKITVPSC
uniref:Uncharacterized protein n=1 Tax=Anguilla anguilla TaxID=7936 RepID=A0A0E9SIW7_ANGAN